jgi:hypothetical protein
MDSILGGLSRPVGWFIRPKGIAADEARETEVYSLQCGIVPGTRNPSRIAFGSLAMGPPSGSEKGTVEHASSLPEPPAEINREVISGAEP